MKTTSRRQQSGITHGQREVWMSLIVGQDVADGLVDHGEERAKSTQSGVVHNVLLNFCELQRLHDNTVRREVGSENSGTVTLHLQRVTDVVTEGSRCTGCRRGATGIFLILQRVEAQLLQEVPADHLCAEDVLAEPDHSATRDSGKSSKLKVLHFKHDAYL